MALTAKMKRFAEEYIVDLNASQAAIRAGYSKHTAGSVGHENLNKPEIAAYIDELMEKRSIRTRINADMVLQRWWEIGNADPNELAHIRRLNCRYCNGIEHGYRWTDENEYAAAVEAEETLAAAQERPPTYISDSGGYGFHKLDDPNQSCPKCRGEGIADLHIADTRNASLAARRLFGGIKQTQAGIEVKFRDQDKALENVARHLGMFQDKIEVSGTVKQEHVHDLRKLDPKELAQLEQILAKSADPG